MPTGRRPDVIPKPHRGSLPLRKHKHANPALSAWERRGAKGAGEKRRRAGYRLPPHSETLPPGRGLWCTAPANLECGGKAKPRHRYEEIGHTKKRGKAMTDTASHPRDWHHAPVHRLGGRGAYMVTAATLHKESRLDTPERLTAFLAILFDHADRFGWRLQAWAVLGNHYHWIGLSPEGEEDARSIKALVAQTHERSAKSLNHEDGTPGRKVWHNYWESHITFETSYYARLKYVHDNPAHHGVVPDASTYRWCSRAWLERTATPAFVRQLDGFKTDMLKVPDDF